MPGKGWFAIPGVQAGDRTIEEQLLGLEPMLATVRGKSVLDLGCAEGLISRECLVSGASRVIGMDSNRGFIERANAMRLDPHVATFVVSDLNRVEQDDEACCHSDVVLMLAILHKLQDPARSLSAWAGFAHERLVIRLPIGSDGVVAHKHGRDKRVDTRRALPRMGFRLEQVLPGPRGELVQHWLR
jgi:SAM-dependent methyltransferase